MAKIDRTLQMNEPPDQAQTAFLDDIGPELHSKAELTLYTRRPGLLEFGIVEDPDKQLFITHSSPLYPLHLWSGPHIHVKFEPNEPDGTRVTITGHCERAVCDALNLLGQPGHWPETKDTPHD